ncbi:hypothetical protein M9H77_04158 [Catharanthus roseus]|uniref:Uncharacterized protein n=1 Tax=Catharanthus roseus TaxID=4058 RepID=A0ACC0CDG3_CATRO|nr:hypothetical protein M9H77_04158 [Catharanthus roseus]
MASSSILNIGRTEGTEVPATPTGNVHVSTCSSDLKYRLYPVEVVFPPLDEPWVSDCHLLPKVIDVVFVTSYSSMVTDVSLASVYEKYLIPDEYVLLHPSPRVRVASPPPGCYFVYEEHLKLGLDYELQHYRKTIACYTVQFRIIESNEYMFYLAAATLASGIGGTTKLSVLTRLRVAVSAGTEGSRSQRNNFADPAIKGVPFAVASLSRFKLGVSDDICDLLGDDPSLQVDEGTEDKSGMSLSERSVNLPFKDGPIPKVDDPFFHKYHVPELDTVAEKVLFCPDWNLNVNNRTINPRVCAEMFDHITMIFSRELLFRSQTAILGASAIANEKMKRLEEEVHELKLYKGEVINIKNAMMREQDTSQKWVYELEVELKEMKSNFTTLEISLIGLAMEKTYRSLFFQGARTEVVLY